MSASHGKSDTPNGTVEATAVRPPLSPTHHRMLSDSTITEEAKSPNSFHDALSAMASPLPYGPSDAALGLNHKFTKNGNLRREESPSNDTTPPSRWEKIVAYYDVWYHRLRVRWVWFVAFLLVSIVCCSIAIGWSFRLRTFNIADPDSVNNAIVQLSANLVTIDPSAQQMTLDWNIRYDCVRIGCPDVDVYFDANTLRDDSPGPQSNVKPDPIFSIIGANVLVMSNNTDRRPSSLTFRTDVAVSNANTHRTLQSYPYDKYATQLVFFAEQAATNESVSIAIVKTTGIAVGFNVQLQNTTDISDNFGTVIKNIEVTRGPVVRLYAIFIVLVIWLVTLTFMATCVLNVFFGKGISSGVLVLPMGTLFAFTQLRATLPGAPEGFGAVIDFIGLLPCLAILTFCSIFMTAIFLLRDPEHDIPRWHWKQPGEGRRKTWA
ncbi:hypothetical protein OH76DRAFT_860630 [Lentinus brumalis]|uniref:Uncharacterized protein n=1 Tax=Lentinus brumalis TaxID=2498619 RepID=A0A371DRA0_9APHY|nr:hypothetical protein OH76DRAFT_860630 [Polyporus brumalis]